MRKLLIGFVALIAIVVGAVLIVPGFIDWNTYKSEISARVEALTGRRLNIDGDITITILPAPAVVAHDVTFANVSGAADPYMVRLSSLEVRIAFGPLLGGNVQVEKVRLVDPEILLEVQRDGSANWIIEGPGASSGTALTPSGTPTASIDLEPAKGDEIAGDADEDALGGGIRLDHFEIVNGSVIYRDSHGGVEEHIEQINATLRAASLQGPFDSTGSLSVHGLPLRYDVRIDGIFQGRTVPINAVLRSDAGASVLKINGNVVDLSGDAKFTGDLKAEGETFAGVLAALAPEDTLPGALNQPFAVSGSVTASSSVASVGNLAIKLGDASAQGSLSADLGDVPTLAAELRIKHVNIDRWLDLPAYGSILATGQPETATVGGAANDNATESTVEQGAEVASVSTTVTEDFTLPGGVAGSLSLVVDAVTYRQEKVGPLRLSAELANAELTISQFSTQLPGATEVAMFGFLSSTEDGPVFEGDADIAVGDSRRLANWLQIDLGAVPNGRLRNVKAKSHVRATQKDVRLSGIHVAFDRSQLDGGVTIALRKRPAFGASFTLDRIDLDGYLQVGEKAEAAPSTSTTQAETDAGATTQSSSVVASNNADPLALLSVLGDFDANVRLKVGELVHNSTPVRGIALDSSLYNGALSIKNLGVADLAGAKLALSGEVSELRGNPRLGSFKIDFTAKSIAGLTNMLALDMPVAPKSLGKVTLSAVLDGPVLQPALKSTLHAAGADVAFDGTLSMLPLKPMVDGGVTFKHPDVARLLRVLGVAYRPAGKIGGVSLGGDVKVHATRITLDDINGKLGKIDFSGATKVSLDGTRPKINANIQTGEINIDPFLPAAQNAALSPAGFGVTARPVLSTKAPWPQDAIDLGVLRDFDGEFRVASSVLHYAKLRFVDAKLVAMLEDGVLNAEHMSAILYGGRVSLNGVLDARAVPSAKTTFSLENAGLSAMLSALTGEQAALGALSFETSLSTAGSSVADMIAALDGTGTFNMKGLDVQGSAKGSPLAGVLGLVRGFAQLGGGLSGQDKLDGLADAGASFTIEDGLARIGDFKLASGLGNGTAAGSVDLVNWQMDLSGTMHMTQNILTQLLAQKTGTPQDLPFSVSGALDAPTIKLDTASLQGGGIQLPGIKKLDEKAPGLGTLLQGVLGGALGTQPKQQPEPEPQQQPQVQGEPVPQGQLAPVPQPQPQQQEPVQQKLSPKDVLKQLLQF